MDPTAWSMEYHAMSEIPISKISPEDTTATVAVVDHVELALVQPTAPLYHLNNNGEMYLSLIVVKPISPDCSHHGKMFGSMTFMSDGRWVFILLCTLMLFIGNVKVTYIKCIR